MTYRALPFLLWLFGLFACVRSDPHISRTVTEGVDTIRVVADQPDRVARARAVIDFGCAEEQVRVEPIARVNVAGGAGTYDQIIYIAHACGHAARYACIPRTDNFYYCVREPVGAELRGAPALTRPSPGETP